MKIVSILFLCLTMVGCSTVDIKESQQQAISKINSDINKPRVVDVHFISRDPFEVINASVQEPKEIIVRATLRLPPGKGPFSALVISPSSAGGYDQVQRNLSGDLVNKGYATFAVHSMEARGLGPTGTNQTALTFQGPAVDAIYALDYLRTLPIINPNKICITGHSRGGQVSLNFTYFESFLKMSGYKGKPFDCNISILSGGHYRPKDESTTRKPALVLIGEKDDAWHTDLNLEWINKLISEGNPIEVVVLKDTYHGLGTSSRFCADQQTAKKCKAPVQYDASGIYMFGQKINRRENGRACIAHGYHCRSDNMDMYPEVLRIMTEFLEKNISK